MKDQEENDALWDLLGKAGTTQASPFFARKVVRAATEETPRGLPWAALWRWLVPASAVAALVLGWSLQTPSHTTTDNVAAVDFNDYFDTAADLQSLVTEDVSSWIAQGN